MLQYSVVLINFHFKLGIIIKYNIRCSCNNLQLLLVCTKGFLFIYLFFTFITQSADGDWEDMICCLLCWPSVNGVFDNLELNFYS